MKRTITDIRRSLPDKPELNAKMKGVSMINSFNIINIVQYHSKKLQVLQGVVKNFQGIKQQLFFVGIRVHLHSFFHIEG